MDWDDDDDLTSEERNQIRYEQVKVHFAIIGEISHEICHAELWLSRIYFLCADTGDPLTLYAQPGMGLESKLKVVEKVVKSSHIPDIQKNQIREWVNKFNSLRKERNTLIHGFSFPYTSKDPYKIDFVTFLIDKKTQKTSRKIINKPNDELQKILKSIKGLSREAIIHVLNLERWYKENKEGKR